MDGSTRAAPRVTNSTRDRGVITRSSLQQFIANEIVLEKGGDGISADEPLVSSGRVDSIGLLQVLGFIQERYGVDLLSTGTPRDFETVNGMAAAIRRSRPAD